jgi:hypothetical protein
MPGPAFKSCEPLSLPITLAAIIVEGAQNEFSGLAESWACDHVVEIFSSQQAMPQCEVQAREPAITEHGVQHLWTSEKIQAFVS